MLRTPLAALNNAHNRPTSPGMIKDTTPFAPRPKINRSPLKGNEILVRSPFVPAQQQVKLSDTERTKEEESVKSMVPSRSADIQSFPALSAPMSVIRVQPPTPLVSAPQLLLTAVRPAPNCLQIMDTPLTTPSRRLAPHEFQEYIKHFRSPVDKFVSSLAGVSTHHIFISFINIY